MRTIETVLMLLVELAYAGAAVVYLRYFMTRAAALRWLCRPVLLTTLALHGGWLTMIGVRQGGLPLVGPGQAMSVMVLSTVLIYLAVEWRSGRRVLGVFVLVLAAAFQLVASVLVPDVGTIPPLLRTARLPMHALPAVLGYAGLSLGAVFALLLLLLRGRIKQHRLGLLYRRLPPLRALDTMSFHATALGFALLTLGIVTGYLWAAQEWNSLAHADPKVIGMTAVWLLYAVYMISPRIPRFHRLLRAWWALLCFSALTFNFAVLGLLVETRHSW